MYESTFQRSLIIKRDKTMKRKKDCHKVYEFPLHAYTHADTRCGCSAEGVTIILLLRAPLLKLISELRETSRGRARGPRTEKRNRGRRERSHIGL